MPRPLVAPVWTPAEIEQASQVSTADIPAADAAWKRDAKRNTQPLLDAKELTP